MSKHNDLGVRFLLAVGCISCLTLGCEEPFLRSTSMDAAKFHAELLKSGDIRQFGGVPYHLQRIVELGGYGSTDILIQMLSDTRKIDMLRDEERIEFWDGFGVTGAGHPLFYTRMGDLADWALEKLYDYDVGYRGYLPEPLRRMAIEDWKRVVKEKDPHGVTIIGK